MQIALNSSCGRCDDDQFQGVDVFMKIELEWTGNVGFKARTRQFNNIIIDEPKEFHGTDTGPSAVEYLGIGVGGCLGSSFTYCMQRMEVSVSSINIIMDVKLSHVNLEDGSTPLRIVNINAEILVKLQDPDDEDVLDLCIESFKKYCTVTSSVMAGIPVGVDVKMARE
ncbi:MAG: OsmC family protein [Promethearchaeota archaeon]